MLDIFMCACSACMHASFLVMLSYLMLLPFQNQKWKLSLNQNLNQSVSQSPGSSWIGTSYSESSRFKTKIALHGIRIWTAMSVILKLKCPVKLNWWCDVKPTVPQLHLMVFLLSDNYVNIKQLFSSHRPAVRLASIHKLFNFIRGMYNCGMYGGEWQSVCDHPGGRYVCQCSLGTFIHI